MLQRRVCKIRGLQKNLATSCLQDLGARSVICIAFLAMFLKPPNLAEIRHGDANKNVDAPKSCTACEIDDARLVFERVTQLNVELTMQDWGWVWLGTL